MALVTCSECGKQISDRAVACPGCGAPATRTMPATSAPPPSPIKQQDHSGTCRSYTSYADVPWYRRSDVNTAFIVIGLGTRGFIPLTILTCILLLTGDIYYKEPDRAGNLRVWGKANKVAALVILVVNLAWLIYAIGQ